MSIAPDWYETYSRDVCGMPAEWRIYKWEAIGPHNGPRAAQSVLVSGAVVSDKQRGKYKGRPDWKSRDKSQDISLSIPMLALDAFQLDWEAKTGNCHRCGGDGQEWAGWSKWEGNKFRDCSRCKATGKAPARTAVSV